jgi:imidazoleglycerol phosphate synthase cyclase subunit
MVTRRVIPCLDVRDGRVVKGVRFQKLRDQGDPAALAEAYEAQGADEIVMLDVSATPEGRRTAVETVRAIRAVLSIPLTVGGGVRSLADARTLLGSRGRQGLGEHRRLRGSGPPGGHADGLGRQCAVLALDAARRPEGGFEVLVRSGRQRTGRDAVEWARQAVAAGAGEVLLTSWDRDGTGQGYDLELLAAVCRSVPVPVIASGGADSPDHLAEAFRAGPTRCWRPRSSTRGAGPWTG